jgi:hypothetical protein
MHHRRGFEVIRNVVNLMCVHDNQGVFVHQKTKEYFFQTFSLGLRERRDGDFEVGDMQKDRFVKMNLVENIP